jgi:hypothetical protein
MPHGGWLELARPYIAAFKAGSTTVDAYIEREQIVYWYRPTLSTAGCDGTDSAGGRSDGWATLADAVFVVTLLRAPGTLVVSSGGTTTLLAAPAGAAAFSVPMQPGQQAFAIARNGANVLAGVSLRDVSTTCPCGIYNYNAFVGAVPPTAPDALGADGLQSMTVGLHVATCAPTPSLAAVAPPYTAAAPTATPTLSGATTVITTTASTSSAASTTSGASPTAKPSVSRKPFNPPLPVHTTSTSASTTSTSSTSTTPASTTPPPTPTSTTPTGCTITASAQVFPTNCLQPGCVWAAPGQSPPDHCDRH